MPEKGRFKDRTIKESYYWMLRQLSSTCFVLAGFSVTTITLLVNFFRWQLEAAGTMISLLLVCSIVFLVAGEFAREAYNTWEYLVAEMLYLAATGLLLTTFLLFVATLPGIHFVALAFMGVGIAFFIGKTIYDLYVTHTIQ